MFPENLTLEMLNARTHNNMVGFLGIEYTEIGSDYLCARMPVSDKTVQPMGILHGGASVVLAETLGSVGSVLLIDINKQYAVGLEVNANHIRSVPQGEWVFAKASILHKGRKTHIWEIKIENADRKLVCTSRLTVAIVDRE
jgi:1,4-dihydroxy-2-naphthoyl-CoA hydrolase